LDKNTPLEANDPGGKNKRGGLLEEGGSSSKARLGKFDSKQKGRKNRNGHCTELGKRKKPSLGRGGVEPEKKINGCQGRQNRWSGDRGEKFG